MKRILVPHQLYYPHMDLLKDRATKAKKSKFFNSLEKRGFGKKAMIYVHIPFCNSYCAFCGFDKCYNLSEADRYLEMLNEEINFYASKAYVQSLEISGIHIGGGTPTYLPDRLLAKLINSIRDRFNVNMAAVNVEGSATTLCDKTIEMLGENNVSRISVGVQSFNEKLRQQINLKATLEDTFSTITRLQRKRIITFIDIMYGFPFFGLHEEARIVESDIKKAIELGVDGIDFGQFYPFYNPLETRIKNENLSFPSTTEVVRMIENSTNIMEAAGYIQKTEYVFCKKGEILLEYNYFANEAKISDCIAIGSKSFGFLNGFKYRNVPYRLYIKGDNPNYSQIKELTKREIERIPIVGFPKLLKLEIDNIDINLKKEYEEKFDHLQHQGLLTKSNSLLALTKRGKCFISNIYLFLMKDEERAIVEDQLKILKME